MIDAGYRNEGIAWVTISVICICVSLYQVALASLTKQPLVKRQIPALLSLSAVCMLLHGIDPGSVYGIIPDVLSYNLWEITGVFSATCFLLIIYGHFQAHYTTLRMEIPTYYKVIMTVTCINVFIFFVVCGFLLVITHKSIFSVLQNVGGLQFPLVTGVLDFHGFRLIYRLVSEAMKRQGPSNPEQNIRYATMLRKMKHFHGIILTVLFVFFIVVIASLPQNSSDTGTMPDPEHWKFDPLSISNLIGWIIFIWWAWVPVDAVAEVREKSNSNKSTHISHGHPKMTQLTQSSHESNSSQKGAIGLPLSSSGDLSPHREEASNSEEAADQGMLPSSSSTSTSLVPPTPELLPKEETRQMSPPSPSLQPLLEVCVSNTLTAQPETPQEL